MLRLQAHPKLLYTHPKLMYAHPKQIEDLDYVVDIV